MIKKKGNRNNKKTNRAVETAARWEVNRVEERDRIGKESQLTSVS